MPRIRDPLKVAQANRLKTKALGHKAGYLQAYDSYNAQLKAWGVPETLLPLVEAVQSDDALVIPPKDAVAAESYLDHFSRATAPLRAWAMVRGIVGYPTEAPDGSTYLKPDSKIVQVADERAHGKPKQPIAHSIDESTRALLEGLMQRPTELKLIEATAEIVEEPECK